MTALRPALLSRDPVADALAGEAAARDALAVIDRSYAPPDELLRALLAVMHDDGQQVVDSPRLRAFCRTWQKHAKGRR
ncbi:MAG: hypothetical protein ACK54X_22660 [Burkholderiales bacterium]|jgi:hypothetical protein